MKEYFSVVKLLSSTPISASMLDLLAESASSVIKVHETTRSSPDLPNLYKFIESIITQSETKASVIILATLYIDRLRARLPHTARGLPCTRHRVFVAAIIVAYKFLNDLTIKNKNWAKMTQIFSLSEVNLMERQFLDLLSFDLNFKQGELLEYLQKVFPNPPVEVESKVVTDPLYFCMPILSTESLEVSSMSDRISNVGEPHRSPSPPPLALSEASSMASVSDIV